MNSSKRIFNKMSIFRKCKFQSKHKKLTEEWALATSLKDLSENDEELIKQEQIENDGKPSNNNNNENDKNITKFTLKYLGKTSIDSERSQNATAEAIKSVIQNSKAIRHNKKPQRVNLNICPRGIEMQDAQTNDILLRVSIYKISYCSADAQHDHVFAFIGSEDDKNTGEEKLSCYVYLCPKRRIAHNVTLTVAKCFENAYQTWRNSIEAKMFNTSTKTSAQSSSEVGIKSSSTSLEGSSSQNGSTDDLLIDLTQDNNDVSTNTIINSSENPSQQNNHRNYLQNTWVSFDDEQIDVRQPLFKENSKWDAQLVF